MNEAIRYEADERCPPLVSFGIGLQGVTLALAPLVVVVAITSRAGGQDESYLSWAIFTALIIAGVVTALQASRLWRFGAGHIFIMGATPNFVAISVLALTAGGPPLLASLMVVASLAYLALAVWLPLLRRIVTPLVSGTVLMLLAATILPISLDRVSEMPPDAPAAAGPVVAAVALAVAVGLALRASGNWRRWSPFIAIGAGCVTAVLFGAYDVQRVLDAPWIGIANPELPGFDLTPGASFWTLLPVFLVVMLVGGVKNVGDSIAVQQASRRRPRVTDFRLVQGSMQANWLGIVTSGIVGTPPLTIYSSSTVSLVSLTGVASRSVGYVIGAILVLLALFPKLPALLLTIPSPVMGTYLLMATGLIFVEGLRTVVQGGLDYRKVIIVAIAFALGAGLEQQTIFADLLGGVWGDLLDNGLLVGALAAILMTLFLNLTNSRQGRRLQVRLEPAALPEIDGFFRELAGRLGWNDASTERLCSAAEEALMSLLPEEGEPPDGPAPRLIIVARPETGLVEMEFMAVFDEENLADRLAHLNEESEVLEGGEISLRLLRHHASSVQHQKYYGLDIITVQVKTSA